MSRKRCVNCRKLIVGEFVKVDGGTVEGTAGTRRRPPVYWCKRCWEENVEFNRKSREEFERKTAETLAKMLAKQAGGQPCLATPN